MINKQQYNDSVELELVPNRSASSGQLKLILVAVGFICLLIAVMWSFLGAWLILPFAGLEVFLLVWLARKVFRRSFRKEKILATPRQLTITSGYGVAMQHWLFNKEGARVLMFEMRHPEDPICIHLVDDMQRIELGRYLNYDDKHALIDELKQLNLPIKKVKFPIKVSI